MSGSARTARRGWTGGIGGTGCPAADGMAEHSASPGCSRRDWHGGGQEGNAAEERDHGDTLCPAAVSVGLQPAGWRLCVLSSSTGPDEVGTSGVRDDWTARFVNRAQEQSSGSSASRTVRGTVGQDRQESDAVCWVEER